MKNRNSFLNYAVTDIPTPPVIPNLASLTTPATALTDDISSMARPTATAKAPKHYPRLGASI